MTTGYPHQLKRRLHPGFTLVEMLIAMTIASAFLSGVYVIFNQILRAHNATAARVEALRNGSSAITSLGEELKQVNGIAGGREVVFLGFNQSLTFGDAIDNDFDGSIDEEIIDGLINTTTPIPGFGPPNDRHANLTSPPFAIQERPANVNEADLGDLIVDVDPVFGLDILTFRIFPTSPDLGFTNKTVTYAVTDFDGESNVLIRQTRIEIVGQEDRIGLAPIAFGVLGFDLLYWNPNIPAEQQFWVTEWDSTDPPLGSTSVDPSDQGSILTLPASVYVRITLQADSRPAELIITGQPVDTVVFETMVNIEEVIDSAEFNDRRLVL
jgi:prepilin-type N-terminal cleavage/methylation domain-containing protein